MQSTIAKHVHNEAINTIQSIHQQQDLEAEV